MLAVLTTLETRLPETVLQFYDAQACFQFGTSCNSFATFTNALDAGGNFGNLVQPPAPPLPSSLPADKGKMDPINKYLNCTQVIPKVWTARSNVAQGLVREGVLLAPSELGALDMEGL